MRGTHTYSRFLLHSPKTHTIHTQPVERTTPHFLLHSTHLITHTSLSIHTHKEQPALAARVATLEAGERLLRRQRYAFPSEWPQARVCV